MAVCHAARCLAQPMRCGTGNAGQASQAATSLLLKSSGRMTLLESCHDRIQHHTAVLNAHHAMLIDPHVR